MLHFDTDYMEGAHPEVMRRLVETNLEQTPGYGCDDYTARAKNLIREACGRPQAAVQFLVGGTQTNATVIDALLARHEGVLGAESAHINVHEAGAIEATGHKVLTLPQYDGKVKAADVEAYIRNFYRDETYEHMVSPGMLYISHPTELGTLYTLRELEDLSRICREANIPLYMDGARLGYGLAAEGTDVTLRDIARLCDVFYIGGTKVGALFGEAVASAGCSVRHALYRRPLPAHRYPCRPPRPEAEAGVCREGLQTPPRFAHQPAVRLPAQRYHRPPHARSHLRIVGASWRNGDGGALRYQLGHARRRCGQADRLTIKTADLILFMGLVLFRPA